MTRAAIDALRGHYRTGAHDLAKDFFTPCISCCARYRRATGFFSSSALVTWAEALPRFIKTPDIRISLLISPWLTDEDRATLRRATDEDERRRVLTARADEVVSDALDFAEDPQNRQLRTRLFAWLVASNRLELRFAFPTHVDDAGIYHEKLGIFDFPWSKTVAFTGSANETISGHSLNYESVDVFRSWIPSDVERVEIKTTQFDHAWDDDAQGMDVVPLSTNVLDRIKRMAPVAFPDNFPLVPQGPSQPNPKPKSRWRHQEAAVARFLERERGVLEMATGTGKTRTALKIARRLLTSDDARSIIVAADGTDLINQWYRELLSFRDHLPGITAIYRHFDRFHELELFGINPHGSLLLTSRFALPTAMHRMSPAEATTTLLVHDEVHRLGSEGNRRKLGDLSTDIRFRLGLSATPEREYDEDGTHFITEHIGPVIFRFTLADAIRRGILSPFDYHPLRYEPSQKDRDRIAQVFRQQAAREAAGDPMKKEEIWIALARVHKTSKAKLPVFRDFIQNHLDFLTRCIVFVETRQYGKLVLEIVHAHRHDFHSYYAAEDSDVLRRFARGDLECLLTCHRLSEGIDIRNLRTVVLFSSARSRLETIQRIGRCLRRDPQDPQKRAQVVDFIRSPDDHNANSDRDRKAWLNEIATIEPEE